MSNFINDIFLHFLARRWSKWCYLFLTLVLALSMDSVSTVDVKAQSFGIATATPVVLKADQTGLTLTWSLPGFMLDEIDVEGTPFSQITMGKLLTSTEAGAPQVPVYHQLVGLPQAGSAKLTIVDMAHDVVDLPHVPFPVPVPQLAQRTLPTASGFPAIGDAGATEHAPNQDIYQKNAFYPAQVATLGSEAILRANRVARLNINPVQVNPVTKQMRILRYIAVTITFDQPATVRQNRSTITVDPFVLALSTNLLNPEAANWQLDSASTAARSSLVDTVSGTAPFYTNSALKIVVSQTGLHVLTYEDLRNGGFPVDTLDPRRLKLFYGYPPQQVAITVLGEEDGRFDNNDAVVFFSQPTFNRYAAYDQDTYFLEYANGTDHGKRIQSRQQAVEKANTLGTAWRETIFEQNSDYFSKLAGRDGDSWYWDSLNPIDKASAEYNVLIQNPQIAGPNAMLTLWLAGGTDLYSINPDHKVDVAFNGQGMGQMVWDGMRRYEQAFSITSGALSNGFNTVQLSLPGVGSIVEVALIDAIKITYPINTALSEQFIIQGETPKRFYDIHGWNNNRPMVYDITLPYTPTLVSDTSFIEGTTLRISDAAAQAATYLVVPKGQILRVDSIVPIQAYADPPVGADYIVITVPELAGAVAPLTAYRANQGLRTFTINTQTIYDHFGRGIATPQAIQSFLSYAYHDWVEPAPLYVLLVGDGHSDPKNHLGWNTPNLIPPYLGHVDPFRGETAADNRFVTVAGDDVLPDMIIGRIPADTVAEVTAVVNKTINYEQNDQPAGWNMRHLMVADNPDGAGNFYYNANLGYDTIVTPFHGQRLYYKDTHSNRDSFREAFLAQFNAGAGMVVFHGHSSFHQWAHESLFQWNRDEAVNDIDDLVNGQKLPFVLEMTCYTGYFHHPEFPTLDESLLVNPNGGAVAVWGSSGEGVATGHHIMQAKVYSEIMTHRQTSLGAITVAAKVALHDSKFHLDLIDTYHFFGDPALKLNLNGFNLTEQTYLPLAQR
ncbi:MAG: C25 family cysteine peptidase [Chloroflexota bacterium]